MGFKLRIAQETMWRLMIMGTFGIILGNIWLTLFFGWTIFLFSLFKFGIGGNYLTNIFMGCVAYYLIKISFKKEHINFYINAVLWLIVLNIFQMALQLCRFDFIFEMAQYTKLGFMGTIDNCDPAGFMGYKAGMGCLMAFGIPLLATRPHKWAIPISLTLFLPLYLSQSSMAVAAGVIGLLFVLWYKMKRLHWAGAVAILLLLGTLYVVKVDMPMGMMPNRIHQWKLVLKDAKKHPITGWGLDSFRNITDTKKHIYAMNYSERVVDGQKRQHFDYWDNPHNLYVSLAFEWGIIAFILLIGYLRQCGLWFIRAIKEPNTLALAGFLLVFFLLSFAQFPIFLARLACFIVPIFALWEIQVRN